MTAFAPRPDQSRLVAAFAIRESITSVGQFLMFVVGEYWIALCSSVAIALDADQDRKLCATPLSESYSFAACAISQILADRYLREYRDSVKRDTKQLLLTT